MRHLPGHPELGSSRSIQGPVLLDLCRRCMAAGAQHVRFPLRGVSMLPTLETGDVAVIEPLGDSPPVQGDIVLFEDPLGRPVIHRVVHIARRRDVMMVVTASDTNPSTLDDPVPLPRIVGRVTAADRDGVPLQLGARRPSALNRIRAQFRVCCAGRPRPMPTIRRTLASVLRAGSQLAEYAAVCVYRLRSSPRTEVEVTLRTDPEEGDRLVLQAVAADGFRAHLGLQPVAHHEPDAWVVIGPRLWPARPCPAGQALLERALQVAAERGATRLYALSRRGWHVRRHLLEQAGFRRYADPQRLARLVQQAREQDPRARDWMLLTVDLAPRPSPHHS